MLCLLMQVLRLQADAKEDGYSGTARLDARFHTSVIV